MEFAFARLATYISTWQKRIHRLKMTTKNATVGSPFANISAYGEYVNPEWVALLSLLEMNVGYVRFSGRALITSSG